MTAPTKPKATKADPKNLPLHVLQQAQADRQRRDRRLKDFALGTQLIFSPAKGHERAGQTVTVTRAPRMDVENPSVRVRFEDGTEEAVTYRQLRRPTPAPTPRAPTPEVPPAVTDARARPSWPRILNLCDELAAAEQEHGQRGHILPEEREAPLPDLAALDATITHRLAILAGQIAPTGSAPAEKAALTATLREYAHTDAARRRATRPGRAVPPLVQAALAHAQWRDVTLLTAKLQTDAPELDAFEDLLVHPHLAEHPDAQRVWSLLARIAGDLLPANGRLAAALTVDLRAYAYRDATRHRLRTATSADPPGLTAQHLQQDERVLANAIARSIHNRYIIASARPGRQGRPHVDGRIRRAIRDAGRAEGLSTEQPAPRHPRASELHLTSADAYRDAVTTAFELADLLMLGKTDAAYALQEAHRAHRVQYQQSVAALNALKPQLHTGPWTQGDILSVRHEHLTYNDDGEVIAYAGMTQYYTRVTIVYGADGHAPTIANTAEIEARAGVTPDPAAWTDLDRWIMDMSDRQGGKGQGRRQDDDEHLIYRRHEGRLILRPTIQQQYPYLVDALDAIRRALPAPLSDVLDDEIPGGYPSRGFHPPKPTESTEATRGGLDKTPPKKA